MKVLQVNGISMNVLDEGDGPAVLLLHGFPDNHSVWRKQVPDLLAAGYRVIAPDLRGCGGTDMAPAVADYGIDQLLGDVIALLDALDLRSVQIIAHDWGAVIGWQFAMANPTRVQRLIALSVGHPLAYASGGLMQKLKGYYIALFQLRGIAEWLLRLGEWTMFRLLTGLPGEVAQWRASLQRPGRLTAAINYYRANLKLLWQRSYPPVTMPVVGIYSDGDRFLTRRQMVNSARHCQAGFRYLELSGIGHWMQLEAPATVNPLLIELLKEEMHEAPPA